MCFGVFKVFYSGAEGYPGGERLVFGDGDQDRKAPIRDAGGRGLSRAVSNCFCKSSSGSDMILSLAQQGLSLCGEGVFLSRAFGGRGLRHFYKSGFKSRLQIILYKISMTF